MISRTQLAAGGLLALAACAPVVTHGPRVRPGVEVSLTGGTPRALCDSPCDQGEIVPRLGFGARYGWTPREAGRPAVLAGLAFPAIDLTSPEFEFFVQAPAGMGAPVFGAGTLVSRRYVMPHAQLGWDPAEGAGVYGTVGYTWFFGDPTWEDIDGGAPDPAFRAPRYFSPSLSLRLPNRDGGAMTLYAAGAFGSFQETQSESTGTETVTRVARVPVRTLLLGATVASPLGRLFPGPVPRPWPRPPRDPPPPIGTAP